MNRFRWGFLLWILVVPCAWAGPPVLVGFAPGPGGLGDLSYNDMVYKGLVDAHAQFRVSVQTGEASSTDTQYRQVLVRLAQNCSIVFCSNTFLTAPLVLDELAPRFPSVSFVLLDDVPGRRGLPDNVISTWFRSDQPSFAAGFLAASVSRTHRIGFVGGVDIDAVRPFLTGFQDGSRQAGKSVAVDVRFLTKKPDLQGFEDPEAGYRMALALARLGDDVIFSVAGGSGNGVIQGCKDQGILAIGVDANQDYLAPGTVLTSVMKRLDSAVYQVVSQWTVGTLRGGRSLVFDYRNGGVSLTPMEYTKSLVAPAVLEQLAALEARF